MVGNSTRRSRKIGLTQGGRVHDGRPAEKCSRAFTRDVWRRLSQERVGQGCSVFRENPSAAYYHPCRGEDYLAVLGRLPAELRAGVRAIVLRRTPRLDAELGIEARRRFGCVILNAFPRSLLMGWDGPPTLAARRHYGRWCSGAWWDIDGKVQLQWTEVEVRRYYLFHLFLHEVGHINQPRFHAARRREEYAENFALEWAAQLGELPPRREG
jgi:hypothetical protein